MSFIDAELRCAFVNHADESSGVPPRQMKGRYLREFMHSAVWRVVEPNRQLSLRGERVGFDSDCTLSDGAPVAFRATGFIGEITLTNNEAETWAAACADYLAARR